MISRRDFFRLAGLSGLGLAGLMLLKDKNDMAILRQVLEKFVNGDPLYPDEKQMVVESLSRHEELSNILQDNLVKGAPKLDIEFPVEVIHSQTLPSNTPDLSLVVPPNFKSLVVLGNFRTTKVAAASAEIWAQFNSDAGASNYAVQRLSGSVAVASAGFDNTFDKVRIGAGASDGAGAGENGFFVSFIPNYASNVFYKSVIALEGTFINSITTGAAAIWTSQWYSTQPIKSIRFFPDSDSLKAGSLISVYGLR